MTTERSQLFGPRPTPRGRPLKPFSAALVLAVIFGTFGVRPVSAQGFISPFVGYIFGGEAGCLTITDCEDKHVHYGVSFGAIGSIVGFESEFAYTPDFFGQSSHQTSSVLTFMGNFMLAPKIGPVQPYGVGGVGLIRNSVTAGTTSDQNQFGWDVGGGTSASMSACAATSATTSRFSFSISSTCRTCPRGTFAGRGSISTDSR
jgi:hypothetical protein